MATRKVGSAGRFGSRYGRSIRNKVSTVEKKQKGWKKCPNCRKLKVKRVAKGIWQCRKCDAKFTGRAYEVE